MALMNLFIIYCVPDTEINVLCVLILLNPYFEVDPTVTFMLQGKNGVLREVNKSAKF